MKFKLHFKFIQILNLNIKNINILMFVCVFVDINLSWILIWFDTSDQDLRQGLKVWVCKLSKNGNWICKLKDLCTKYRECGEKLGVLFLFVFTIYKNVQKHTHVAGCLATDTLTILCRSSLYIYWYTFVNIGLLLFLLQLQQPAPSHVTCCQSWSIVFSSH